MILQINTDRLLAELHHLATLTDCPPTTDTSLPAPTTAVTRIVFTPRDLEARAWLKSLAIEAGFETREDAVGNTFLRWPGTDPTLGAVGTGSPHRRHPPCRHVRRHGRRARWPRSHARAQGVRLHP